MGGIINDNQAPHHEDFVNVGGRNLKKLDFKSTNESGTVMNLYDIPVQFALLLSTPSLLKRYIKEHQQYLQNQTNPQEYVFLNIFLIKKNIKKNYIHIYI